MSASPEAFLDTNILLYLLSADRAKADRAERIVEQGGVISVQVLNEFVAVATRKLGMTIAEAGEVLRVVRSICTLVPVAADTHDLGVEIARRHQLSMYDAMIAAAARLAGCKVILSEDMQDGLHLEGMRIRNPL